MSTFKWASNSLHILSLPKLNWGLQKRAEGVRKTKIDTKTTANLINKPCIPSFLQRSVFNLNCHYETTFLCLYRQIFFNVNVYETWTCVEWEYFIWMKSIWMCDNLLSKSFASLLFDFLCTTSGLTGKIQALIYNTWFYNTEEE